MTSDVPIHRVFSDENSNKTDAPSDHLRSVMDDLVRSLVGLMAQSLFTISCSGFDGKYQRKLDIHWGRGNLRICARVFASSADGEQGLGGDVRPSLNLSGGYTLSYKLLLTLLNLKDGIV